MIQTAPFLCQGDYCKDATRAAMPVLRFDVALVDASSDCRVTESTVTAKYLKGTAQKLALMAQVNSICYILVAQGTMLCNEPRCDVAGYVAPAEMPDAIRFS